MRSFKLTRSRPLCTPCLDELPIFRKFYDAVISALTVRDEEITVRGKCDVGGAVEKVGGVLLARDTFFSYDHELLSLWRELEHLIIGSVGNPEIAITIDIDTVCFFE